MSSDADDGDPFPGRDHCGATRNKNDDPCQNPAVAPGYPCARHIRDRVEAICLSGGLDLDADIPGSGDS